MSSDRLATGALLAAMLAVGAAAWWLELRPDLEMDAARLAALPLEFEEWGGFELPLESGVERMLNADLNLQRAYLRGDGSPPVWLYVGYYGTARGGRPEHTPQVCYPSAGWKIEVQRQPTLDATLGPVNEMVVSHEEQKRLVHFWYRSSRSAGLLGAWAVSLDQLEGRLSDGRADGALLRLSTPLIEGDLAAARERLLSLRWPLEIELDARWPEERPKRG